MTLRLRELTGEEQSTLEKLAHSRTAPARMVERARILGQARRGEASPTSAVNRYRQVGGAVLPLERPASYQAGMTTPCPPSYAGDRFPAEIIGYAVWLYFRFPLSLRMVEERLAVRGILVSHGPERQRRRRSTVRQWGRKFGREIANGLRRRAPRRGDKWPLDEVVITIAGQKHWLWRAVDQDGFVLDVLVQSRRDTKAAKRRLRKLLKKQAGAPRVMITDKLKSYGAAKRALNLGSEHRQHKGLNNRADNSHQPTRRRERQMKRFKSSRQVQRFLSTHDPIANLFHLPRNRLSAPAYRAARAQAFETWAEVAGARLAA